MDIRILSLKYFNLNVLIQFKPGSESYAKHGKFLRGILIERTWGEGLLSNSKPIFESNSSVVGLKVKTKNDQVAFPCEHVETISLFDENVEVEEDSSKKDTATSMS